jgi:4-hydroxybenzoate polyprenyltransferase
MLAVADLIRLSKQYGTLLLMMPTLWSLVVASRGMPSLELLLIFTLGSFVMRSAGCILNDIADRHFDPFVARTKHRPLASGRLTVAEALVVLGILLLIAFGLVIRLNRLALALSPIGILLAILYPYTKRYLPFPQFFLGLAFGWGAIMAWAAVRNSLASPAYLIFLANIFWAMAYDTLYAVTDKEDDLRLGLKSTAILFGRHAWWLVGLLLAGFWVTLVLIGWVVRLNYIYYLYLFIIGWYCLYQTWTIKKSPDGQTAFALFKSNVGVGIFLLSGFLMALMTQRLASVAGQGL